MVQGIGPTVPVLVSTKILDCLEIIVIETFDILGADG